MSNKISVIIPTFNRQEFISKTLDNFINQTLKPYEIIVIDQNSSDDTVKMIKKDYKDKIILIENKGNRTPGRGRNLGLEVATGDYIQFFDSDDLLSYNKLEIQSNILENTNNVGVYCPYFMAKEISNKNWQQITPVLQSKALKNNKNLIKLMTKGFFTPLPLYLFQKDFIKKVGKWREDIFAYEDYDYLFRMVQLGFCPEHTDLCCVLYRVHGNQITGNSFSDKKRDLDKQKIFSSLLNDYSNSMTKKEKIYLETQLARLNLDTKFNFKTKLANNYLRIENKINRIISKSDWQIAHSPNNSKELFEKYLNLIIGE